MSFREGIKQALKKAEGDVKRTKDDIKAFLKGSGSSRPSTPFGSLPHTNSIDMGQQTGNHNAGLLAIPPSTLASTDPSVATRLDEAPIDQDHSGTKDLSLHTPEIGPQDTSTMESTQRQARVASQSHASESARVDMLVNSNESAPAEQSTSQHTPRETLGASTRKDLKQLATGVAEQVIDTLKIGPLRDVSYLLQSFADMYKMDGTVKSEYEALQDRLQALLKVLEEHSETSASPMVASKITDIREFIEGELGSIEKKPNGKQHGRFLMAKDEEERFMGCCRRIQKYLDRLSLDTSLSMWKLEDEKSKDRISSWVRLLPSSPYAWYNSSAGSSLKRRECTPGTRVDVLANLLAWTNNNSTDAVYWLNGMAGTGKTTIAYSVCKELDSKHKLAASFFCSRIREECRDVNRIIPSIAYQLAQLSLPFQSALSAILERDQNAHHKVLTEQFETLIRKPLLALTERPLSPERLIVVIDALDECDDKDSTRDILNVLLSKTADLPIKLIVSSRPEAQVRDQMIDSRVKSKLVLHELDTGDVQADIETYLREELKPMSPSPTESQIAALVNKAGILFIYAATAVRYISHDHFHRKPDARLRTLLGGQRTQRGKKLDEIDDLYMTILEAAFGDQGIDEEEQGDMEQVIYTVICAREPLTVSGLSELLQITDIERVRAALRPLWSVLHVVGASELVTTLHASFPDFMFDSARSKAYRCDPDAHHRILAKHCFERINRTQPQFNICGLESSYLPDDKVPNIEKRVADAISSDLLYACQYWADHVKVGKCALTLAMDLQDFLSTRLLIWMEVLNLNKQMRDGVQCMKLAVEWCNQLESHQELVDLANDALRFVDTFASNPVSQSTPHIYVSMMTFWPRSAPIAKYYAQFTHGPVEAEGPALYQRQLAHLTTWAFDNAIGAMAVSPDGRYIALGMGRDVLVVDSSDGKAVLGPLHGPSDHSIESIVFSPDQTYILAGFFSLMNLFVTITGWDTRTGDTVLGPLQLDNHNTIALSRFMLSPDCTCIAIFSLDKNTRLWNTENGNVLRCLETYGHVSAAAFSSDGIHIAAGFDQTLQIWNSQTGDTTLGPLTTGRIFTIVFSPDKSCIVHTTHLDQPAESALYVRDAQNGDIIHKLSTDNAFNLTCLGYSPDGRHIVSGGSSIQVWDAQNGQMVLGPLEGHTGIIDPVGFLPDGSRIVSACSDGLVCTWDARQRNLAAETTHARSSHIYLAKFSADGTHFVSFSEDNTLRICDSHTGAMVVGPLAIHAYSDYIPVLLFTKDHIALGSGNGIFVYDALSGQALSSRIVTSGTRILALAYSPDGTLIAAGSIEAGSIEAGSIEAGSIEARYPSEIYLWDAQTGTKVLGPLEDIDGTIYAAQFSPDGTRIVASYSSSRRASSVHGKHTQDLSPDAQIVLGVWDVSDGKNVLTVLTSHAHGVYSISCSPDGALIASGSDDKTITVWDAYTGSKILGPLVGHSDCVRSVHFSPDSTRLVSGSEDRTIRIWDVRTGDMVFELVHGHEKSLTSVSYSPDGTRILSCSFDGSVRIHDAQSIEDRALSCVTTEYEDWKINKDGWVAYDQSRLLVWVPADLWRVLMHARTRVVVAPWGYVRLRFDTSRMGESWAQSPTSEL